MNWLALFMQYFPAVLQAVVAVEHAIGSQSGASKKQVVMSAVSAAAKVGAGVNEQHVQVISQLIDSTVTALNTAGVFGKSATATGPTQ